MAALSVGLASMVLTSYDSKEFTSLEYLQNNKKSETIFVNKASWLFTCSPWESWMAGDHFIEPTGQYSVNHFTSNRKSMWNKVTDSRFWTSDLNYPGESLSDLTTNSR